MDSWRATRDVEDRGRGDVEHFLRSRTDLFTDVVPVYGSTKAQELQQGHGDFICYTTDGKLITVDVKVEVSERHGNLFLETFSNRSRFNRGWLDKVSITYLVYYFLDTGSLYVINFRKLREWAFGAGGRAGRIYEYPEKPQNKYKQNNDTYGRCVPIRIIREQVGLRHFRRNPDAPSGFSDVEADGEGAVFPLFRGELA
jgi:hypothetical protein